MVQRKGAKVVAISVDSQAKAKEFAELLGLSFPTYSDVGGATIKKWGIYDTEHEIAVPSTFIVNGNGKIIWSYIGKKASDRPDPELIEKGQD